MLLAIDSLGKLTEMPELKFIQRVESCQIHSNDGKINFGRTDETNR